MLIRYTTTEPDVQKCAEIYLSCLWLYTNPEANEYKPEQLLLFLYAAKAMIIYSTAEYNMSMELLPTEDAMECFVPLLGLFAINTAD